jgi:Leucine-rich repeat (LRR) protein
MRPPLCSKTKQNDTVFQFQQASSTGFRIQPSTSLPCTTTCAPCMTVDVYRIVAMLIFVFLFATSIASAVPLSEISSLYNLFTSTNGIAWDWRPIQIFGPKWIFNVSDVNPCSTNGRYWQGIECNSTPEMCQISSCSITSLSLTGYGLIGDLPQDWTNFTQLQTLTLPSNQLSGFIPSQLPFSLKVFNFGNNLLHGPLPASLQSLTNLRYFRVTNNFISSSIEACLVSSLESLYLESNLFDQSLPLAIGSLTKLEYLDIASNLFSGRLPSSLGNLQLLTLLNIGDNYLSGSLPSSLGSLSLVDYFDLRYNSLTGAIPSSFGQLEALTWLALERNFLSSSLPSELQSLIKLQILDLSENHLTHEIPCALSPLSALRVLDLYGNYFSSFSSDLLLSSSLEQLILSHNLLSGLLPPFVNIQSDSQMNYLEISHNLLTGTLPSTMIEGMRHLFRIDLGNNHLTGSVSFTLSGHLQLLQIFLPNNELTGTLAQLLERQTNGTSLRYAVSSLDLSGNLLSGTLSPQLFDLSLLESLALTSNCFHGTIPPALCDLEQLLVLSFDGLGSAYSCPKELKIPFTNVVYRNLISGSLPACVWKMSRLQVMSLAGNGLSGTIGSFLDNSSLINLTLSHNHMGGTLPLSLQHHPFELLDLSYNKFSGDFQDFILVPAVSVTSSVSHHLILQVNRLSGVFPHLGVNESLVALNALRGNLFGCQSVPKTDANYDSFICGSRLLDIAFFAFGSLLALIGIVIGACILFWTWTNIPSARRSSLKASLQTLRSYYQHSRSFIDDRSDLSLSLQSLEAMKKTLLALIVVAFLTTVPLLLLRAFRSEYSTHTNLNRWSWTTAYLTGQVPCAFLLLSWMATLSTLIILIRAMKADTARPSPSPSPIRDSFLTSSSTTNWRSGCEIALSLSLNILVMGALNVFYILSYSTHDLSSTDLLLIQLTVVFLKMFWSACCLPLLDFSKQSKRVRIVISVLNSLFIPCIVTALSSPACYQVLSPISLCLPPPSLLLLSLVSRRVY